MVRRKRQFHCEKCGSPCEIYHKGKHRVLVCPQCGVLATNPIRLPKIMQKAYNTVSTLPVAGTVATGLEEFGIIAPDGSQSIPTSDKLGGVSGRATYSQRRPRFDWAKWAVTGRG